MTAKTDCIVGASVAGIAVDDYRRHSPFKRVYLAGPYRGIDKAHTTANIQDARTHAIRVHKLGGFAITPHLLCALFDYDIPDTFLEQSGRGGHRYWLDGLLDLLLYCDCVYVFNADPNSKGTAAEIDLATRNGIPVFYTEQELDAYLNTGVKNDTTSV